MARKLTDELKKELRDIFVHGVLDENNKRQFPTIDQLSSQFDVSRATLYRFSSKNQWQEQKNNYQTELQIKLDAERMENMVRDGKRLDDSCIQIAMGILQTCGRQLQRALENERNDPRFNGIQPTALNQLSNASINAQKIAKLALGEAQEINKVSADVSNPEAFRAIMDQLDELAEHKSSENSEPLH
tara:strand:- start:2559 stop:3119 length:561 start_codon:yes stop_codon:yes gene_type:complete